MAASGCYRLRVGRKRSREEEEGGQGAGMLKGIGHDRERKYLLLCLQAWLPWRFVTGNLWWGLNIGLPVGGWGGRIGLDRAGPGKQANGGEGGTITANAHHI